MEISQLNLRIWRFSNVVLRLPSVFILEAIHQSRRSKSRLSGSTESLASHWGLEPETVTIGSQYLGYFVVFLLHALPLRMLIKLYKFIVVGLMLLAAHLLSAYSLSVRATDSHSSFPSAVTFALAQGVISLMCAQLMGTKHVWAFAAYVLPQIANLSGLPLDAQKLAHGVAQAVTLAEVSVFTLRHVLVPYRLALIGYKTLQEYVELYGIISVIFALYNRFFVPMLYLIFWLVLFAHRLYVYYSTKDHKIFGERWALVIFAAIADCCESPWSLLGLCYTVSYTAFLVLLLCKMYLKGFNSLGGETFLHRGWTEGITVMLLAMETGLLELKKLERILLLSVLMYIALSSTIQSVYEILDPVLLALAASNDRSPWKHFKALSMCLALMATPLYLSYMLFAMFEAELWLMIIVSSCLLTTVQTFGSLTIYLLFMADHRRSTSWESLDDVVYGIHAMCHVLEFGIALSVLFYGGMESFHRDYNLLGAAVILVHCYFNVLQRAQAGWQSFLHRRDAVRKIKSLPTATQEELSSLRDVCAICFEEMAFAKVTPCRHYFHSVCLRRWLYVQDKCPLCHKTIIPEMPKPSNGGGDPEEELPRQPHQDLGQGDAMMAL
ncbi:RING finger protein 145-like [Acanthaster planci]|uniref:RING finger protein 145-like n=1 Tax=Acanthaster planci TaxID=133434 RepID=A0A8B7YHJ3_ACAPL|nr:RING finger protein 145-like [Acanthaster planci]